MSKNFSSYKLTSNYSSASTITYLPPTNLKYYSILFISTCPIPLLLILFATINSVIFPLFTIYSLETNIHHMEICNP